MNISLGKSSKSKDKKPQGPPGMIPEPHKSKPLSSDETIKSISNEINNLSRRLRVLEERYTNLRKKMQLNEQNMLHVDKKIITEIKKTNKDVDDTHRVVTDVKEKMLLVIKDLKGCAKREDVKVIEKYVNMWEPVQFVTLNQLKDVVEITLKRALINHGISQPEVRTTINRPDFSAAHKRLNQESNIIKPKKIEEKSSNDPVPEKKEEKIAKVTTPEKKESQLDKTEKKPQEEPEEEVPNIDDYIEKYKL